MANKLQGVEEEEVANELQWKEKEVANKLQQKEKEEANELQQQGLEVASSCNDKERKWQVVAMTRRGSGKQKDRVQQQSKQSPAANKKELIVEKPLLKEQTKEQVQHWSESTNLMSPRIWTSCNE